MGTEVSCLCLDEFARTELCLLALGLVPSTVNRHTSHMQHHFTQLQSSPHCPCSASVSLMSYYYATQELVMSS